MHGTVSTSEARLRPSLSRQPLVWQPYLRIPHDRLPPPAGATPTLHLLCPRSKAHLVREADATQQPAGDGSSAQSHCEAQWLPTRQAHLQRLGVMRKECK